MQALPHPAPTPPSQPSRLLSTLADAGVDAIRRPPIPPHPEKRGGLPYPQEIRVVLLLPRKIGNLSPGAMPVRKHLTLRVQAPLNRSCCYASHSCRLLRPPPPPTPAKTPLDCCCAQPPYFHLLPPMPQSSSCPPCRYCEQLLPCMPSRPPAQSPTLHDATLKPVKPPTPIFPFIHECASATKLLCPGNPSSTSPQRARLHSTIQPKGTAKPKSNPGSSMRSMQQPRTQSNAQLNSGQTPRRYCLPQLRTPSSHLPLAQPKAQAYCRSNASVQQLDWARVLPEQLPAAHVPR